MFTKRRKTHIRSCVCYSWSAPSTADSMDETPLEKLLGRAVCDGVVVQFDTGRGRCVWFVGAACAELRKVRDAVHAMLPADWVQDTRL